MSSTTVEITKLNNSFLSVASPDAWLHEELYDLFKVHIPGSTHTRHTHERFYNKYNGKLPLGLLPKLLKHCKSYKPVLDPAFKKSLREHSKEEIREWMDSKEFPFTPYDYQYDIVVDAIRLRRLVALADTGAGKSAILYFLVRFYVEEAIALGRDGKVLVMIPNITLRSQILQDFRDYGWDEADGYCHLISDGRKWSDKRVIISTWQSIQNMDDEYFEQFTNIIVDEVHGVSAKKQTNILKRAINASDRIGLTGTLAGTDYHKMQVEQFVGASKRYVVTKQLQEMGQASATQVFMTALNYTDREIKMINALDYIGKVDFIHLHEERMKYLCNFAEKLSSNRENVLLIFEKVEKGVERYRDYLESVGLGDRVRVVTGEVKGSDRDEIKAELEANAGHIFLATWGTLSTGVNIKNLHSLMLVSSSKGRIRVLQTVGRLLRIHASKKIAKIFDFTDVTSGCGFRVSNFVDHAKERFRFYKEKGHPVRANTKASLGYGINTETYSELLQASKARRTAKELQE